MVDSAPLPEANSLSDLAYCSVSDDRGFYRQQVELLHVCGQREWEGRTPNGRWMGMVRFRDAGITAVQEALEELEARPDFSNMQMSDLLNRLIETGQTITTIYTYGHWLDLNNLDDLERANAFAYGEGAHD